ncbi:MAG TPA: GMC family oxidoreductase [Mycobacteriales bacterium]|nr:GMC family oxidoreductase [Mycobacteriales bacterium]
MRISREEPGARADEHVDTVVVGSGFGGSVAAYRFAEAGRSVVVLERGKEYPPGSFPRTPAAVARAFWDPSLGLHGMYDVWRFRGLDAVVSSAVGGGSLIYANVLLRKDERWFVHEDPLPRGGYETWPLSRADLDPHYDAVETMLGAQRYPFGETGYAATAKTAALGEAARRLGLRAELPPLAVSFAPRPGETPVVGAPIPEPGYGNLYGLPRRTCTLRGECDLGCNEGAKNTLDHTYLSAAAHHGARIHPRHEVRGFAPRPGGGYLVHYVVHDGTDEGHRTDTRRKALRTIGCDRLVLAAGALGTTFLLLRSRSAFPALSQTLGTRFCGNGDLLGALLGARDPDGRHRAVEASHGPVITTAVRIPDRHDGAGIEGRGYYIEDAGYPAFVDWLIEGARVPGILRRALRYAVGVAGRGFFTPPKSAISAELARLFGGAELSDGALPLLGMGRDVPDGVLRLRGGQLAADWTTETSEEYFTAVRTTMADIAAALHARFTPNPLSRFDKVITVHPLGGAPMGRSAAEGVCDSYGEVFGYPGLHVADGAAMPGPVGANPALTIAAFADRLARHALEAAPPARRTAAAPTQRRGDLPPPPPAGTGTSVAFTEEMKGFVTPGDLDPGEGARLGRADGRRLMFRLTITADDVDRFVTDPSHPARAEGWVDSDLLGGRLEVVDGSFNLFVRDGGPRRRRMLYRLHLVSAGGNPLTLVGHKEVADDPGQDVWRDTSTLFTRILAGHVEAPDAEAAPVVATGVLTIHIPDFLRQLTTFRAHGPQPVHALESFGRLFLGELWTVYGQHLTAGTR